MAVSKWVKKREKRNRAGEVTGTVWRATYVDSAGKEHSKHFARKVDASQWLDSQTADLVGGIWVDPSQGKATLRQFYACCRSLGMTMLAS